MNTEIVNIWHRPATIEQNNFAYKSLSNWSMNIAVGCGHGCRFCYVPEVSTKKQAEPLREYGVKDPDAEWGQYVLLRSWDADKFYASLDTAKNTPKKDLKLDGNRAVIYCSTTDPYQVFRTSKELTGRAEQLVRNSLEIIRDHSDLNVRILTRGPLAKEHFGLFKSFGDRLLFGMSLPTLNDKLCKVYEPNAPGPNARLKTLQLAKDAGLNVYVAMAPTYPECDEQDLRTTLTAIKGVKPLTVFHEPINIRAENVARIEEHAEEIGQKMNTAVFADKVTWRSYALKQLFQVQTIAGEVGLENCLHLWPDSELKNPKWFKQVLEQVQKDAKGTAITDSQSYYDKHYLPWLKGWWSRISEWPGKPRQKNWKIPKVPVDLRNHLS